MLFLLVPIGICIGTVSFPLSITNTALHEIITISCIYKLLWKLAPDIYVRMVPYRTYVDSNQAF